jgi:hypothetical protein
MTVSAISPSSASFVSTFQQDRQAFGQLTSALQSGDLSAAQNAYNTLSSSPIAQGNTPFAQALQQIGQDLQAGDIGDAQKALASLQQQQQARGGHHHHHHGGGGVSKASDASKTSDSSSATDPNADSDTVLQIDITVTTNSDNKVDIKA